MFSHPLRKFFVPSLAAAFLLLWFFSEAGAATVRQFKLGNASLVAEAGGAAMVSYAIAVGDLDGDGVFDYLARVWKDDPIVRNFKTITYAIRDDGRSGTKLWEYHHDLSYEDIGGDPTWTVSLSVWDMDGDGRDEVITQKREGSQVMLVLLEGLTGREMAKIPLGNIGVVGKVMQATIAYLDGPAGPPYLVITHGKSIKTIAFGYDPERQTFVEKWRFDDSRYSSSYSQTNIYTANIDGDDRDEIVMGPLLLDDDGSLYLDGTSFIPGSERQGTTERSFVADIDPENPGMEWYLIRGGRGSGDDYMVEANYWEGPYLIDVDQKKLIWHHNVDAPGQGWGRLHRGWVRDIDPNIPGMEMLATGYFWEGNEWQNALSGKYGTPPAPGDAWVDGYSERYFLFDKDQNVLSKVVGTQVGYPVYWDDDPGAEYYRFRQGQLLDKFDGKPIASGWARAHGSGESIQADVLGDWREEIITVEGDTLFVYSNDAPTAYPDRPSPRANHIYRVNMASLGTGLPKPLLEGPGTSSPPPQTTKGDINKDGRVDVIDLGIMLSIWGSTQKLPADLNQDGRVDVVDLGILLSNWGSAKT